MNSRQLLIKRFKEYFRVLHLADFSQLHAIYANNVVFRDPGHEARGLVQVEDYFTRLGAELDQCRFEYLDALTLENSAYIKWIMHFEATGPGRHRASVRGVSHIQFSDKIDFHEDIYDMSAMHGTQLPALGNLRRWLKLRLAS